VVGDIAAGGTANIVGGVVTRALDPTVSSDDVLSAGEISQDAVSGFVGGGVGHLAGTWCIFQTSQLGQDPFLHNVDFPHARRMGDSQATTAW
jgi:hypothetical protein